MKINSTALLYGALALLSPVAARATEPESIIHVFGNGLGPVAVDGKWGFIDKAGRIVIKPQFDGVSPFQNGHAYARLNGKSFFIDKTGKQSSPPFSGSYCAPDTPDGLCPFWIVEGKEGRWGYMKEGFEVAIEPRFSWTGHFSDGWAIATTGKYPNDKTGFIDKTGKWVIEPIYDYASPFSEELAKVVLNGRHIFIKRDGTRAFDKEFRFASDFKNGLAPVNIHFEPTYKPENYNLWTDGKYGFIDKTGNWAIPPQFEMALGFIDDRAIVKLKGSYGLINTLGEPVVPATYGDLNYAGMGLWRAEDASVDGVHRGPSRLIDGNGKTIVRKHVMRCQPDGGGLCSFSNEQWGKVGFMNTRGTIIVPPTYDATWGFSEGIAAVKQNSRWGYIDTTGKLIWKPTK